MIKNLLELEVEGFRIFRDKHQVPLDAGVVLIYGPNGSGKTGLLHAIEFALTGAVTDLHTFTDDYPRCLTHIRPTSSSRSSLLFEGESGEKYEQEANIDESGRIDLRNQVLSKTDQRFFSERCYLSQAKLGRLFEIYQAIEGKQSEQPLVRFVRELLGLDLIDNLTTGLHEIGNIARIRKASTSLRRLEEEEHTLSVQLGEITQQHADGLKEWEHVRSHVQELLSDFGDPAEDAPWTIKGLHKRRTLLEDPQLKNLFSSSVHSLEQSKLRLHNAQVFLQASDIEAVSRTQKDLEVRLTSVEQRRSELESKLIRLIEDAEQRLQNLSITYPHSGPKTDVDQRLGEIEMFVADTVARFDAEAKSLDETKTELLSLEKRLAELDSAIKDLSLLPSEMVEAKQRWAETLHSILDHVHGDDCPVCGRDYSELGIGDLRSHLLQEIDELGGDIQRLESEASRRAKLEADKGFISRQIAALEDILKDQPSLDDVRASLQNSTKLANDLAAVKNDREAWVELRRDHTWIRSRVKNSEIASQQHKEHEKTIMDLADELDIPKEERAANLVSLAEIISSRLSAQIEQLQLQSGKQNFLVQALKDAEELAGELDTEEKRLLKVSERKTRVENARKRVDSSIKKARSLARAATNTKTNLFNRVFNESLNGLCTELFRRLVKTETFLPHIRGSIERGKIRVGIHGSTEGVKSFEQLASVLSSGNLNTAALSLFLSLHLIEEPRHHLLILDDPVQNMDDVHVVQMAGLLRALVHQANRQLVISVHERALFDYLCLELGPTRQTDSLITIELSRNGESEGVIIEHDRHVWKSDPVRLVGT